MISRGSSVRFDLGSPAVSPFPTSQRLALLTAAFLITSCTSETSSETVDLTITQTVHVAFGTMEGNVPETAIIQLGDLRENPGLSTHRERLRCLALDREATVLRVVSLEAVGLETPLAVDVEVAPASSQDWTKLASFEEFVQDGALVPVHPNAVREQGEETLATLALSGSSGLDLALRGEVPEAIDDLSVELDLSLYLSSVEAGCAGKRETASSQGDGGGADAL